MTFKQKSTQNTSVVLTCISLIIKKLSNFSYVCWLFGYSVLWSIWVFCPFVWHVYWLVGISCAFGILALCCWCCKYILSSYDLPFYSVSESFDKQKWLILLNSSVSIFTLWLVFFVLLNKSLPTSRSQSCFLCYLWDAWLFGFSRLDLQSTWNWFFLYDVKEGSRFIVFHMDIQLTEHHFFKKYDPFPLLYNGRYVINQVTVYTYGFL